MDLGLYTFAELTPDPATGRTVTPAQRLRDLIEEIELADQVGLDVFGVGEHHRPDFSVSAPVVALAAAAERTTWIRLTSAVTVLETILFQHEVFGHQRVLVQFSVGTMPHERIMRSIERFGTAVAPVVREEVARRTRTAAA